MICCGQKRDGNFCSECGKAIQSGPLVELMRHIEHTISQMQGYIASYGQNPKLEQPLQRRLDAVEKWTRWRDALSELIEGEGKDGIDRQ